MKKNKITVGNICQILEDFAPLAWQESYDNSGLLIGQRENNVSGILLCIDVTEEVIAEALQKQCNFILSHHPLIFSKINSLTDKNYIERCIRQAIKNDIAIYAAHTNIDNAYGGVSFKMAQKIGLQNLRILHPKENQLLKLITFVPEAHADTLRNALFIAGAGCIGNYDKCSYSNNGYGTFRASENAHPFIGKKNEFHTEPETRIEVILPKYRKNKIIETLIDNHPYEEPAFDLIQLDNRWSQLGCGIIGELSKPENEIDFLKRIKHIFRIDTIKHNDLIKHNIRRVAVCGGSGAEFIGDAMQAKADVYLSADLKYHDFFIPENKMLVADIGHFESEQYTKEIFFEQLTKKIPNFAIHFSQIRTNKINYL